jgi:hypothetical protein
MITSEGDLSRPIAGNYAIKCAPELKDGYELPGVESSSREKEEFNKAKN